jgi:hypothetical protein
LLKRIDDDAAARSMTRSGYLALGARRLLGEAASPFGGIGGETGKKIQEEVETMGRRLNDALGPESTIGRTLADLDTLALDGLRRLGQGVGAAMRSRARPTASPPADPVTDDTSPPSDAR